VTAAAPARVSRSGVWWRRGFGVWGEGGFGCRAEIEGSGFGVWGKEDSGEGFRSRVQGLGTGVWGLGFGCWCSRFKGEVAF